MEQILNYAITSKNSINNINKSVNDMYNVIDNYFDDEINKYLKKIEKLTANNNLIINNEVKSIDSSLKSKEINNNYNNYD